MTRPYIRAIPFTWWLRKRAYLLFMLRELTVVFIGAFLLIYLVALARGADAYETLLTKFHSSGWVAFHVLALTAAVYHSVTWFNLAPKIMVVRVGEDRVSPALIAVVNYGIWVLVSIGVAWVFLGS